MAKMADFRRLDDCGNDTAERLIFASSDCLPSDFDDGQGVDFWGCHARQLGGRVEKPSVVSP